MYVRSLFVFFFFLIAKVFGCNKEDFVCRCLCLESGNAPSLDRLRSPEVIALVPHICFVERSCLFESDIATCSSGVIDPVEAEGFWLGILRGLQRQRAESGRMFLKRVFEWHCLLKTTAVHIELTLGNPFAKVNFFGDSGLVGVRG